MVISLLNIRQRDVAWVRATFRRLLPMSSERGQVYSKDILSRNHRYRANTISWKEAPVCRLSPCVRFACKKSIATNFQRQLMEEDEHPGSEKLDGKMGAKGRGLERQDVAIKAWPHQKCSCCLEPEANP